MSRRLIGNSDFDLESKRVRARSKMHPTYSEYGSTSLHINGARGRECILPIASTDRPRANRGRTDFFLPLMSRRLISNSDFDLDSKRVRARSRMHPTNEMCQSCCKIGLAIWHKTFATGKGKTNSPTTCDQHVVKHSLRVGTKLSPQGRVKLRTQP